MALSNTSNKTVFSCNGSTVNFDFDFKVFDEGDLEVILYTIADGTETTLTLDTDYSTSLITDTGGRITTVDTYSSLYKLIARRKQSLIQELDYTQNDALSTLNLEEQLDKVVMMIQDLKEQVDRAVKFDASVIEAETVVNLPDVTATVTQIDINGLTEKTAPVDDDVFIIEDSEDDYNQKKVKKTKVLAINTLTEKTTLADNDLFLIEDSAVSNTRKKVKKSNIVDIDTDGTLAANSDTKVASQKAVKTYADTQVATKISKTIAGEIYAMTVKETLADADVLVIEDSAASYAKKKATKGSLIPSTVSHKVVYTTGSGNWTAPAGVTTVYVTMCGGGGGGAGNIGGGGGGSESFVQSPYTVVPTNTYAYSVGAAGTGGASDTNGVDGGNSTFGTGTVFTARGGKKATTGAPGSGGAAIGGVTASGATAGVGTIAGGAGADGATAGGGGGASIFGIGGAGGANGNGTAATGYGSGGGGGGNDGGSTGGAGTGGIIILEY